MPATFVVTRKIQQIVVLVVLVIAVAGWKETLQLHYFFSKHLLIICGTSPMEEVVSVAGETDKWIVNNHAM